MFRWVRIVLSCSAMVLFGLALYAEAMWLGTCLSPHIFCWGACERAASPPDCPTLAYVGNGGTLLSLLWLGGLTIVHLVMAKNRSQRAWAVALVIAPPLTFFLGAYTLGQVHLSSGGFLPVLLVPLGLLTGATNLLFALVTLKPERASS